MDGWMVGDQSQGTFAGQPYGTWIENPTLAQDGNRFVSLQSHLRVTETPGGNIVDYLFGSLTLKFGGMPGVPNDPAILYGPALAANQTYELSFWARDFGANLANEDIPLFWFDHTDPMQTYTEEHIPSPFLPTDIHGNGPTPDPNDPNVPWVRHVFTFTSTDGNGTFGVHLSSGWDPYSDKLVSHTLYLDNFQLVAVPEPGPALLLALSLLIGFFRRSR